VPYLRVMLAFLGLTDLRVFRVEGVQVPPLKEEALAKGIASIVVQ
jgi:FMN-dependent NADH-azoreductase